MVLLALAYSLRDVREWAGMLIGVVVPQNLPLVAWHHQSYHFHETKRGRERA